ncbi:MAG: hypothetical protein ABEK59_03665 [Halobacteria archaeon]
MEQIRATGMFLTVLGLLGYVAGVFVTYPGRAFSLTSIMLGLPLVFFSFKDRNKEEAVEE